MTSQSKVIEQNKSFGVQKSVFVGLFCLLSSVDKVVGFLEFLNVTAAKFLGGIFKLCPIDPKMEGTCSPDLNGPTPSVCFDCKTFSRVHRDQQRAPLLML